MFQFSYPHMLFLTKRHHFYKTSISEAHFISYESFKIPYHSYLPISWLFPCSLWNLALGYTSLWMSTSLTEELRTVGPSQHQQPLSSVPMSSLWALLSLITALIGIQLGNCLTMSYTPPVFCIVLLFYTHSLMSFGHFALWSRLISPLIICDLTSFLNLQLRSHSFDLVFLRPWKLSPFTTSIHISGQLKVAPWNHTTLHFGITEN